MSPRWIPIFAIVVGWLLIIYQAKYEQRLFIVLKTKINSIKPFHHDKDCVNRILTNSKQGPNTSQHDRK